MAIQKKENTTIQLLEKLGLTENEALLYTIMIKHPHVTVQQLQNFSPFPRTQIYHILRSLSTHGLVSFIRQPRRTVYVAEDPQTLYNMLEEREKEFEKRKTQLKETIPSLRNQFRLAHERPGVQIFQGIEEYRRALEDVVESKPDHIYSYIRISEKKKPGLDIRKDMNNQRIAWGIKETSLIFDSPQAHAWLATRNVDEQTSFRLFPENLQAFEADLRIYDGKVAYTTYEGRDPIVMITQDMNFYSMQKNMFLYFWEKGTVV